MLFEANTKAVNRGLDSKALEGCLLEGHPQERPYWRAAADAANAMVNIAIRSWEHLPALAGKCRVTRESTVKMEGATIARAPGWGSWPTTNCAAYIDEYGEIEVDDDLVETMRQRLPELAAKAEGMYCEPSRQSLQDWLISLC